MIGTQDLLVGLAIVLFFYGGKKLPELASSLGKSMKEFKKGLAGDAVQEESSSPATSAAVSDRPSHCPSCRTALQPDWSHCPRCGAAVPVATSGETDPA